ncbi:phage tail assembly chaperone [Paenibacillus oleatilyticus]|uniref:phage tail assembly chaperone n=1 Tax=Paenibacillus oleatilyticus TaxID=2594886 RepID=UPI001C1FCAF2|nr:hypothetical protein [Paenibacillus oleatilyticus]MBU7320275.1 hypothetical protein [Paenibacillus oleatilyticus]
MGKQLTIQQLLEQKEALKNKSKRRQKLYVESLDAEIVIQEPSRDLALEAIEMAQGEKSDMADIHITYHCVVEPNLKDTTLQMEFGCVEPTDIVGYIFRPGEISAVSGHALQLAGYASGVKKVDEELKN